MGEEMKDESFLVGLVAALVADATALIKDVASLAIKDAYQALKRLVIDKICDDRLAIELLEKKPLSNAAQLAVVEALADNNVHRDEELKQQAEKLSQAIAERNAATTAEMANLSILIDHDIASSWICCRSSTNSKPLAKRLTLAKPTLRQQLLAPSL
jgi:hypothetical protein